MLGITMFISNIPETFGATDDTSGKTNLSGKVTDKETGDPIPGVAVYINDLKTGAVSSNDGTYKIDNLPQTTVFVQVTCIGYNLVAEQINLKTTSTKNLIGY